MSDVVPEHSVARAGRFAFAGATFAALAWFVFEVVSVAFRLGARIGIRSAAGVALPLVAASYGFASGRRLRRIGALPFAARGALGLAAGAIALASVPYFLRLLPIPASELAVTSCMGLLALAFASDPKRSMPLFYGAAAGMILYVAVYGVPRVVP